MKHAHPLPAALVQRYHGWNVTSFARNKGWHRRLAEEGQRPGAMIISCCDSRVHATAIFGAEPGEFFIHRNIAALVPPCEPGDACPGTAAAIEYAVTGLRVARIVVLGHSQCGGVAACHAMCSHAGPAPARTAHDSFVSHWVNILRPGYARVQDIADADTQRTALEKQAVLVSLTNLMTFPFVADAVRHGALALHGLWIDIARGDLHQYDAASGTFVAIGDAGAGGCGPVSGGDHAPS